MLETHKAYKSKTEVEKLNGIDTKVEKNYRITSRLKPKK